MSRHKALITNLLRLREMLAKVPSAGDERRNIAHTSIYRKLSLPRPFPLRLNEGK